MNTKKYFKRLLACALVLLFSACAPPVKKDVGRLFFPPLPLEPKVEFLKVYIDQHTFSKSDSKMRMEAIFGKEPSIGFKRPLDVASNGKGYLYVADPQSVDVWIYDLVNETIKRLDPEGEGIFLMPVGLAADGAGKLYVADRSKKRILVFTEEGKPLFSFGGTNDELAAPVGIAVDASNDRVYVSDVNKHHVAVYDLKGRFIKKLGKRGEGPGEFNFPVDLDVSPEGYLVVADTMNSRIHVFDKNTNFVRNFGKRGDAVDSFDVIKGVGIDPESHIYITDVGQNAIKVYSMEGDPLMVFGGNYSGKRGIAPGGFTMIAGISVDNKGGIFVADQLGKFVQSFQYLTEGYLAEHPVAELEEKNKTLK